MPPRFPIKPDVKMPISPTNPACPVCGGVAVWLRPGPTDVPLHRRAEYAACFPEERRYLKCLAGCGLT
jgi:hypothetical protein